MTKCRLITVHCLYDEDGNLRSFREFKKLALQVSKDYNVNWLQTEYNTAVRSARNAVNFRKWLETEHLYPNLEYMESTASHPRASHLSYVGTVLPIRHPWWNTHMPPSAWNCACSVRPTDKDVTPVPGEEFVPPVFQNNPGKTAEFVNLKEHSYIKGVCPYFSTCLRRKLSTQELAQSQLLGKSLKDGIDKTNPPLRPECAICELAARYAKLAKKMQRYEGITFDKKRYKSGGEIEKPTNADQNKQEKKKNLNAFTFLAKEYGRKYRILPVIEDGEKNPDALNMDTGFFSDAKVPVTEIEKNAIQSAIKEAAAQKVEEVVIHCQHNYSYSEIWKGLKASLHKGRAKSVQKIIIIMNDGRIKEYNVADLRNIIK